MEEASLDQFLKEHMQILAKSDILKEDLTDSIAYFKGKYFVYSCKTLQKVCKRDRTYNVRILNFFTDMLLQFDLIYADPPKQFTKSGGWKIRRLENCLKVL